MHRIVLVAVALLLLPTLAQSQSRLESFTTALTDSGSYQHETAYEFNVPAFGDGDPDVIADIYWNTTRVWLITGSLACEASDGQLLEWGNTTADNHFAQIRTMIPKGSDCYIYMAFGNSYGREGPQNGAVRVNVSATTGGDMTVTKVPDTRLFHYGLSDRVREIIGW